MTTMKSQTEHAKAVLEKYKIDPIEEMALMLRDPDIKIQEKIRINSTLMKYRYPELKSVEVDQVIETKIIVNIAKFSSCLPEVSEFIDTQVVKEHHLIEAKEIIEDVREEKDKSSPETASTEGTAQEEQEEIIPEAYLQAFDLTDEDLYI